MVAVEQPDPTMEIMSPGMRELFWFRTNVNRPSRASVLLHCKTEVSDLCSLSRLLLHVYSYVYNNRYSNRGFPPPQILRVSCVSAKQLYTYIGKVLWISSPQFLTKEAYPNWKCTLSVIVTLRLDPPLSITIDQLASHTLTCNLPGLLSAEAPWFTYNTSGISTRSCREISWLNE